jgi:ParB/RepB/Spo0J family partition protein
MSAVRNSYATVPVTALEPAAYNPNQLTHKQFDLLTHEVMSRDLVLKPIVVRKANGDGRYVIVDGEHNWRAAKRAELPAVPVEVIEADEYEARRQTLVRNKHGRHHKVKLGRMYREMLDLGAARSGRDIADDIGVSEGSVRNTMLYARLADLCAGRDGMPSEDDIAKMGIRQVRELIDKLLGKAETPKPKPEAPPKEAADEPSSLHLLKHHWDRASEEERAAFLAWVEPAAIPRQVLVRGLNALAVKQASEPARNGCAETAEAKAGDDEPALAPKKTREGGGSFEILDVRPRRACAR